ncbi:MAG: hypothetical protein A2Z20_04880 [Bdellovibrionales bacterium RBG_16_40_8]|nr:MAG: hypothetical protein A2Z20_04880 [Bdellovibrionales bacterium RBG_16_40_8]
MDNNSAELEAKINIIEVCKQLHQKNMLAAGDGNVSVKISDDEIIITPTGKAKAYIAPNDFAKVKLDGTIVYGNPSSELAMHLKIYRSCEQAKAVVHAHPTHTIAWSLARPFDIELPCEVLPEVLLSLGRVPIIPYARPSSDELAHALDQHLQFNKVFILQRHGALSWGESLDEGYFGIERIEHSCQILYLAYQMGQPIQLDKSEIGALKDMRRSIGLKTL